MNPEEMSMVKAALTPVVQDVQDQGIGPFIYYVNICRGKGGPKILKMCFGEPPKACSPKACVTNSGCPPANLKGKRNPDLPSVCSNYWPPNVAQFVF